MPLLRSRFVIVSLLALGEYVGDKLPNTPNRTAAPGLIARIVLGAGCGASLCAATGQALIWGIGLGAIGAAAGAFGGYEIRTRLVRALGVRDPLVAIAEDVFAICLGFAIVRVLL